MVDMEILRIIEKINDKEKLIKILSTYHKYDIAQIIKLVEKIKRN